MSGNWKVLKMEFSLKRIKSSKMFKQAKSGACVSFIEEIIAGHRININPQVEGLNCRQGISIR